MEIETHLGQQEAQIEVLGSNTVQHVTYLQERLAALSEHPSITIDLGQVARIDTAGAWALIDFEQRQAASGATVHFQNVDDDAGVLLRSVRSALPKPDTEPARDHGLRAMLESLGKKIVAGISFIMDLTGFLGVFLVSLVRTLIRPGEFRLTALVAHAEDVGFRAVPIVALMAFLIGVVLAFQGSIQLRQFGAEVFVVDLIAISILRELGILLTAIIVAGRTASAFTAAIGSMKMREEIDAMRTLGLDPATLLFVPRILALIIMLPILGLIANVMGLFGGMLMSWLELGISPSMFMTRLQDGTALSNVTVGMVKAPVFALIIGVVGCHAGMQVEGNAESLGRMTSNAVVTAIFAVIVADALFSIFFAQVGL